MKSGKTARHSERPIGARGCLNKRSDGRGAFLDRHEPCGSRGDVFGQSTLGWRQSNPNFEFFISSPKPFSEPDVVVSCYRILSVKRR